VKLKLATLFLGVGVGDEGNGEILAVVVFDLLQYVVLTLLGVLSCTNSLIQILHYDSNPSCVVKLVCGSVSW